MEQMIPAEQNSITEAFCDNQTGSLASFTIPRTFIGQTPAFLGPRKQSWSLKAGILITSISSLVIMISLLVYLNQNPKVEPKKLKDSTKIDNFHDLYKVYSYIDELKTKVTQLEGEMQLKQDTPICKCDEDAILEQTQLKIDQIKNNFEILSHEVKQSITEVVQNASIMASEYEKSFKENSRLFLLQTEFLDFKHQFDKKNSEFSHAIEVVQKSNNAIKASFDNSTLEFEKYKSEQLEKDWNLSNNETVQEQLNKMAMMLESTPLIPRTCEEYGSEVEGFYTINPSKNANRESKFRALCLNGTTQVLHDHVGEEIQIEQCTEKFCFSLNLDYGEASNEHINALIETSQECHQDITFDCYASKFSKFAAFNDTNGNFHEFFTHDNKNVCECSLNDSCFEIPDISAPKCDCDHGDPVQRQDRIKVTKKDFLPIKTFLYGHMHIQDQKASLRIGPLICKGLIPLPTFGNNCESRLAMGQPPGYYISEKENQFSISKCTENGQEDFALGKTIFEVILEVHRSIDRLSNGESRKIAIDKKSGTFSNSSNILTGSFQIPGGTYEISVTNFKSQFSSHILMTQKSHQRFSRGTFRRRIVPSVTSSQYETKEIPVPNQSAKVSSKSSDELEFKIAISTPEKLCTDSERTSQTLYYQVKSDSHYYSHESKQATYYDYKPTCTKPSINIPCSSQNPCIIQMRGYF